MSTGWRGGCGTSPGRGLDPPPGATHVQGCVLDEPRLARSFLSAFALDLPVVQKEL